MEGGGICDHDSPLVEGLIRPELETGCKSVMLVMLTKKKEQKRKKIVSEC